MFIWFLHFVEKKVDEVTLKVDGQVVTTVVTSSHFILFGSNFYLLYSFQY